MPHKTTRGSILGATPPRLPDEPASGRRCSSFPNALKFLQRFPGALPIFFRRPGVRFEKMKVSRTRRLLGEMPNGHEGLIDFARAHLFAVELKADPIIVGTGVEGLPKLLDGRTLSIRGQSRRLFETAAHFPGFPEVLLFCVVLGHPAPGKCHPLGMRFDFADQLGRVAALRPMLKEFRFLFGGKSLKRRIMFEKAMLRGHEGWAA